jgi:hypothetical protein
MKILTPPTLRLDVEGGKKEKFGEFRPGTVLIALKDVEEWRQGDELPLLGYCQTAYGVYIYTKGNGASIMHRIGATDNPCHEVLFTDLPEVFAEIDLCDYKGCFMVAKEKVRWLHPAQQQEECKVIQLKLAL